MHGGCDYNHTDYAEGVCANLLPKEPCIKATDVIWWLTLAASWRATWTSISSSGHLKKKIAHRECTTLATQRCDAVVGWLFGLCPDTLLAGLNIA